MSAFCTLDRSRREDPKDGLSPAEPPFQAAAADGLAATVADAVVVAPATRLWWRLLLGWRRRLVLPQRRKGTRGSLLALPLFLSSQLLGWAPRRIGWRWPLGVRLGALRLPHPATTISHRSLERVDVGLLSFPGTPHVPREADGDRRLVKSIRSTNWETFLLGDLRFG
jgi:hypothetical protein